MFMLTGPICNNIELLICFCVEEDSSVSNAKSNGKFGNSTLASIDISTLFFVSFVKVFIFVNMYYIYIYINIYIYIYIYRLYIYTDFICLHMNSQIYVFMMRNMVLHADTGFIIHNVSCAGMLIYTAQYDLICRHRNL